MERTNLEVIAPTAEEAIASGLEQLGVSQEMVNVEILDEGSRGFLGMGGRQARVRLTLKADDSPEAPASSVELPPVRSPADPLLDFTVQTANDLLERMKLSARVSAAYGDPDPSGEKNILVDVRGDDLSVLIGRRAETLNALQYILGLIVSKQAETWVQVTVDVEGYRARREKQLRQLARRMAEQAVQTGKRQVLEPMSSAERRIIHLELREVPEVISESIGEDPNRKVTISLKA